MRPNAKGVVNGKSPMGQDAVAPKKSCLSEIQRLQKERDDRRKAMEQAKLERANEEQRNRENGTPGDVDFQRMIRVYRDSQAPPEQVHIGSKDKICICIRKRPISTKEINRKDYDSVTCLNPVVVVHDCKLKVDGISKYLDNTPFEFDHTFHEDDSTDDIYSCAVNPLIDFFVSGGRATCFAYGQTGSGKTFTMQGIQKSVADDLFIALSEMDTPYDVMVSYFEIYGGRCQDLLNNRQRLNVREDGNGEVVVSDLLEVAADTAESLQNIIDAGNRNRTTHATESNDESSRSHAICQIALKQCGTDNLVGRFSLIDLAGSERGADTKSHNRQRRMEGAEINKSLLALKECIRALDSNSSHVPYRASKLTLVLKDSFTNRKSRTVMIATVSPAASSADHTINTLRYADRIKERVVGGQQQRNVQNNVAPASVRDVAPAPVAAAAPAPVAAPPPQPPRAAAAAAAVAGPQPPSQDKHMSAPTRAEGKGIPDERAYEAKGGAAGGGGGDHKRAALSHLNNNLQNNNNNNRNPPVRHARMEVPEEDDDQDASDEFSPNEDDALLFAGDDDCDNDSNAAFHRTVQDLFEEEEDLLNLHMSVIQENAELLTEEGRLLQSIQGDNNDIDSYATRLDQILTRKQQLINVLQAKLDHFRHSLQREETISKRMSDNSTKSNKDKKEKIPVNKSNKGKVAGGNGNGR